MATVQLPAIQCFYTKIEINKSNQNADISLAQEFQKHLSNASRKHGILDNGK